MDVLTVYSSVLSSCFNTRAEAVSADSPERVNGIPQRVKQVLQRVKHAPQRVMNPDSKALMTAWVRSLAPSLPSSELT